ncbi:MAG TPA: hypothetical protein VI612_05565, partial [Candidatus Nanoarchaeia archaeon]|nr:hypothetical protein [Candidatus Nanoarchaeia archaeon]
MVVTMYEPDQAFFAELLLTARELLEAALQELFPGKVYSAWGGGPKVSGTHFSVAYESHTVSERTGDKLYFVRVGFPPGLPSAFSFESLGSGLVAVKPIEKKPIWAPQLIVEVGFHDVKERRAVPIEKNVLLAGKSRNDVMTECIEAITELI